MCWPYTVEVLHQPLPNIFINAFSHKLSGIFKEPCATQSVCSCHHLCWAPAHLPLHYWATSSDQLFSMRFRFSVNLQRWDRKVLRLFGHSCSRPLDTDQRSNTTDIKQCQGEMRKEDWRSGWFGGLGSLDKTVKDTWTLGPLWRCWDAADTESDKLYCSSKATPLCLYSTLSPTMVPTMVNLTFAWQKQYLCTFHLSFQSKVA